MVGRDRQRPVMRKVEDDAKIAAIGRVCTQDPLKIREEARRVAQHAIMGDITRRIERVAWKGAVRHGSHSAQV